MVEKIGKMVQEVRGFVLKFITMVLEGKSCLFSFSLFCFWILCEAFF